MQLLAVACLSLAAKMEEILVPSLFDFQVNIYYHSFFNILNLLCFFKKL